MRLGKRLYSLVMFLLVSVLGGMLVAGLAVPLAGLAAETGKSATGLMENLPAELETPAPAERTVVKMANGATLVNFYDENRQYVTLDKIAPVMRQAIVAVEDHRFYEHGAIDVLATMRAAVSTLRGVTQGASSLTQQYVKQVQISEAAARGDADGVRKAQENTIGRKVQELRYAMALEKKLTKDQILERYLNIAYFGDGAYGVEAAALHFYGVRANKLTLAQASMLAGLVRNPVTSDPINNLRVAMERRSTVLDRMASSEVGVITPAEAAAAKAEPYKDPKIKSLHGCANTKYPFICDYVERTLLNSPSLGATKKERKDLLYRGGLTIQTQINPKSQDSAQKAVTRVIDPRDPVDAVMILIEPKSRLIVAMAQNRYQMGKGPGQTYWNMAVSNDMGGTDGYQGGSTFKIFVAAAALQNGYGSNVSYNVRIRMNFKDATFGSCRGTMKVNKDWNVVSDASGRIDLTRGTALSVNAFFVLLESAGTNLCDATKIAKAAGLRLGMPDKKRDLVKYYSEIPSFTLGAVEVSAISLVNAYATFANRGVYCDPLILKSIKTRDGTSLAVPEGNCKQAVDPGVADGVNRLFQGPVGYGGTAPRARVPGIEMAGKTGTVNSNKAAWFVGYTPELVGGAMISYSNDKRYRKFWNARGSRFLRNLVLPYSRTYLSGFGSGAGVSIFRPAFAAAIKNYPKTRFTDPSASMMSGKKVDVPYCGSIASCRTVLRNAGFVPYTSQVESETPKGTFLGTSPSGVAVQGSGVAILISKGPKPKPTPTVTITTPPAPPGRR